MPQKPRGRRLRQLAAAGIGLAAIGLAVGTVIAWWNWKHPYGRRHVCIKQVAMGLHVYADHHNGELPGGEATNEASLSLLFRDGCESGWTLAGKTKDPAIAEAILAAGNRLDPDTCDWHYVEGLRIEDGSRLAVVWDKIGLGHNCERIDDGGHEVGFLDGSSHYVPAAEWDEFIAEQRRLWNELRKQGRTIRPPAGYDAPMLAED